MKTDNELIAEFMGGRKQIIGDDQLHGYSPGTILWHGLFDEHGHTTYLSFDDDWEWLMPVVEKIESLDYEVDVYKHACEINTEDMIRFEASSKIEACYKAVVEFIKWHNQQTK